MHAVRTPRAETRRRAPLYLLGVLVVGWALQAGAAEKPSYDLEDVKACSPDAMRLCKDKLPDLEAIRLCMKENYARLRPACKARFDLH